MRRYSIMAIRVHGKDQLVVQFRVRAPFRSSTRRQAGFLLSARAFIDRVWQGLFLEPSLLYIMGQKADSTERGQ